jgi:nucleotide-binding universal stress UspA family protein
MGAPDGSSSEAADARLDERANIFGSVLVGIDGSPEALEAARQASVLTEGRLVLLAVYDIATALVGGTGPAVPAYYDEERQRSEAERTVSQARAGSERLASAEGRIARGTSWDELIREVEREQHTLVVVGSHGQGRIKGILLGSTATELVHKAPCPVLVARADGADFPRRIVVGVDGSPGSAASYAVARQLSERFAAELRAVVAQGATVSTRSWWRRSSTTSTRISPTSRCRHSSPPRQTPISSSSAAAACTGSRRSAQSASASHIEPTARHWSCASRTGSTRRRRDSSIGGVCRLPADSSGSRSMPRRVA